jgi:hypothetical protein
LRHLSLACISAFPNDNLTLSHTQASQRCLLPLDLANPILLLLAVLNPYLSTARLPLQLASPLPSHSAFPQQPLLLPSPLCPNSSLSLASPLPVPLPTVN